MNSKSLTNSAVVNPWEDAILTVNGSGLFWGEEIVLVRGRLNRLEVKVPPMVTSKVALYMVTDGGLSIEASPAFNSWVSLIDGKCDWALTPGQSKSGRVMFVIVAREVVQVWEHHCMVLARNLAEEAVVKIDGVEVTDEVNVLYQDQAHILTLDANPDSPMDGLLVRLTGVTNVDPANWKSDPPFGSWEKTRVWEVAGSKESGPIRLNLDGKGSIGAIDMASTLVSTLLDKEVKVLLDDVEMPPDGADFPERKAKILTFDYKNAGALESVPLALDCIPVQGIGVSDIKSDPPFGELTKKHQWKITPENVAGKEFKLKVSTKGEKATLLTPTNRVVP